MQKAGGEACANYNSVVDGDKVVQTALDTYGRIDILINNVSLPLSSMDAVSIYLWGKGGSHIIMEDAHI